MTPAHLLSATEAAAAIAAGTLTSERLVAACLERIRSRELGGVVLGSDAKTLVVAEWIRRALD